MLSRSVNDSLAMLFGSTARGILSLRLFTALGSGGKKMRGAPTGPACFACAREGLCRERVRNFVRKLRCREDGTQNPQGLRPFCTLNYLGVDSTINLRKFGR